MSRSILRRFRTLSIALAVTFLTNYAISMVVESGATNPPPRPAPMDFDSGATNPPPRP